MNLKSKFGLYHGSNALKFGLIFLLIYLNAIQAFAISTICREKSDGISRLHFMWLGGKASADAIGNLKDFCVDIKNKKDRREKFEIDLWGDSRNFEGLVPDECQDMYKPHDVSELTNKYPWTSDVYNFYMEEKIFAAASDIFRPLMLKEMGGCYLDIGFKLEKNQSLIEFLKLRRHLSKNPEFFVYDTGSAGFWAERSDYKVGIYSTYNGFMAANRDSNALNRIIRDFEFKSKVFENNPILKGLFRHCATGPLVMNLFGQSGFNQVLIDLQDSIYQKLQDENAAKSVFNETIKRVKLHQAIPYSGKNSWSRTSDMCMAFKACLYNKVMRTDKQIQPTVKGSLSESELTGSILMEMIGKMRNDPNYSTKEFINSAEEARITAAIRNYKPLSKSEDELFNDGNISEICRNVINNSGENKDIKNVISTLESGKLLRVGPFTGYSCFRNAVNFNFLALDRGSLNQYAWTQMPKAKNLVKTYDKVIMDYFEDKNMTAEELLKKGDNMILGKAIECELQVEKMPGKIETQSISVFMPLALAPSKFCNID